MKRQFWAVQDCEPTWKAETSVTNCSRASKAYRKQVKKPWQILTRKKRLYHTAYLHIEIPHTYVCIHIICIYIYIYCILYIVYIYILYIVYIYIYIMTRIKNIYIYTYDYTSILFTVYSHSQGNLRKS